MRLGIVVDRKWDFFDDIFEELSNYHQIDSFQQRRYKLPFLLSRMSKRLYIRDFQKFLLNNDVVLFEWAGELLATASNLPKSCGIVTRLHRYELYRWADKINWSTVDKIILVSQAKQQEFSMKYPNQASKIVVIPEAVSVARFMSKPKQFKGDIGILSNIIPRKRIYELVLTFYDLCQQDGSFHLHVGGGSRPAQVDYYEAVHLLVEKLNLQSRVTFYDHVTNPEDWYNKIDIFVSNSYSEGLQVAPIEAMASGCFCLSHRWGGADELLPEENLFYTNSELKEKIFRYAGIKESEKQDLRERMREIVCERFNIDTTKVQIRQLVEAVGLDYQ